MTDMHIFGETGLIGARRGDDGLAVPLPLHAVMAPSGSANAVLVVEIARSGNGTLALRGPMVPRHPSRPVRLGSARRTSRPTLKGFVDTFYPCRSTGRRAPIEVTGPAARASSASAPIVLR
jgi:hypothetical protein